MNQINSLEVPKLKFPYISLLATGKHSEIVLNRGVGLHTVLGMTIDIAIGNCIDKAYVIFKKYEKVFRDDEQVRTFVENYNREHPEDKIPEGYFDFLK